MADIATDEDVETLRRMTEETASNGASAASTELLRRILARLDAKPADDVGKLSYKAPEGMALPPVINDMGGKGHRRPVRGEGVMDGIVRKLLAGVGGGFASIVAAAVFLGVAHEEPGFVVFCSAIAGGCGAMLLVNRSNRHD